MVRFSGSGHNNFACENAVAGLVTVPAGFCESVLDTRCEAPASYAWTVPTETPSRPIRPRSLRDNQAQ
jgi:hypothetical protein